MKQNRRNFIDKQNFLLQNILVNSREGSRRKLKSINFNIGKPENSPGRKKSYRYENAQNQQINLGDTIQLPTFGDWKAQAKGLKQRNNNLGNTQKLNKFELPVCTSNTEQQQKPVNQRLKCYEQSKLKQFTIVPKSKIQSLPLQSPIFSNANLLYPANQNLNLISLNSMQTEPIQRNHRGSIGIRQSLSSRVRALSRQFQNFQTIDDNLNKIINRKQIFKKLYLKQKQKYQQILNKYQIQQKIDDSEFQNYFKM